MKINHVIMGIGATVLVGGLAWDTYLKKNDPTNIEKRKLAAMAYGVGGGVLAILIVVATDPNLLSRQIFNKN